VNKNLISAFILCALSGCAGARLEHKEFCVPTSYAILGTGLVPVIDEDNSTQAFRGCGKSDALCLFPHSVISGLIQPRELSDWSWESFPPDAFYVHVLKEGRPRIAPLSVRDMVVVTNPELTDDWYVWKLASGEADPAHKFGRGDRLIFVCSHVYVFTALGKRARTECTRTIQGEDYGVIYTFVSEIPVPMDSAAMDERIRAVIESWRCKKRPHDGNGRTVQ
jgi:hypothetical protein